MAFKRHNVLQVLSLFWLYFNHTYSADPDSILVSNEWELVNTGWPIEDISDSNYGKRTQFYYIKSNDKTETFKWKFKPLFIQQFKDYPNYLKLSFKYWSHFETHGFEPQAFVMINKIKSNISDIYKSEYLGEWMSCEFVMSYQNLTEFNFRINSGEHSIIAFKDFKIESETQTPNNKSHNEEKSKSQEVEGFSLIQWEKYSPPPPSDKGAKDFLFFSDDCTDGCTIGSDGIESFDHSDRNITKVLLSFMYWISGTNTKIELSNGPELKYEGKLNWTEYHILNDRYDKFIINVKTVKNKYNEKSFVAIKDLTLKIFYTININGKTEPEKSDEYKCTNSIDCVWKINQTFLWSKEAKHLNKTIIYYYPLTSNNSFEIARNDNLTENNVCFEMEYWTSFERDLEIKVYYNAINDTVKDMILSIKPETSKTDQKFQKTRFCLRELIALTAKKYVISISVEQFEYSTGINNFALKIDDLSVESKPEKWDFESKFLSRMTKPVFDPDNWDHEWPQLNSREPNQFFHKNSEKEDCVQFTANTDSKIVASAQLNSRWIEYNPNLHLVDPQYSIQVTDKKMFNTFKIKPKVCDWLSHCLDVIQKVENNTEMLKEYSFKFSPFKSSGYINLRFYIEFFKPPLDMKTAEIKFELKLLHFGDPCFTYSQIDCGKDKTCRSDEKKDIPNKPHCDCDSGMAGEDCKLKDYCKDAKTICSDSKMECENLEKEFRCICNESKEENIIWDSHNRKCQPIETPYSDNWEFDDKSRSHYPIAVDNSLTYGFKNINTKKFDICLELKYKSNQIVDLNVNYKFKEKVNVLFNASLMETESKEKTINFCVRDFRYEVHEEFSLQLKISGIKDDWNETAFSLIDFKPKVEKIKEKPVLYISNWDLWESSLGKNPALTQKWASIPNFNHSNDEKSFNIVFQAKLHSKRESKAILLSDWIINNTNFSFSDNFYAFKFKKGFLNKFFRIRTNLIYEENDEIKLIKITEENTNIKDFDSDHSISEKNKILIPNTIKSPFKIIFEIIYNLPEGEKETDLEITFQSISIGDPCFKYNDQQNICQNNGTCHGIGPNQYVCNCSDPKYGGKNCEFSNICNNKPDDNYPTNEAYCASLPSVPSGVSEKKCIALSNITFQCKCPENDYSWNSVEKRCVRNGYQKHIHLCEGKRCEFFDTILTDTKWSNKNLPIIKSLTDPILPFYYPTKNNAKLNIHVNNLDHKHDACLEFYYQISANSNLEISYKNSNAISLTPTQVNGAIDWFPSPKKGVGEILCARSLVKDIDMSFDIAFVAKLLNIENDMLGLRFKKIINTDLEKSFVNFTDRDQKLITELQYLTHWKTESDVNLKAENQWPLALPKSLWTLNSDDSIGFTAIPTPIKQTAYLMSNWLMKDINGYKLRFNISGSKTNYKNFVLQIIIFDDQMQQKQVSNIMIGDKNLNNNAQQNITKTVLIPIQKMKTSFRVALKVDYLLSTKNINPEFRLESIDLGDPCILDNTLKNLCSGRGECRRNGAVNNYTCICNDGYTDKNCQTVDYCSFPHNITTGYVMNGTEFCKLKNAGNCFNRAGRFWCSCTEDTFWDTNLSELKCQNKPKCITKKCDFNSEFCKEPTDEKTEAICECKPNYINVSTTNSVKCEKYDPCNEIHRNLRNPSLGKPCGASNASCISYGNEEEYMCVCPKGFQNIGDHSHTECKPVFCSFPSLNPCQQICKIDETDARKFKCSCTQMYDPNGDNCKPKLNKTCNCKGESFCRDGPEDCICKDGYKPFVDISGKINGCQPNLEYLEATVICPKGKLSQTIENKLSCNCDESYKLNDKNTCDLKPICGKGGIGRIDCDSRNAECHTNKDNIGNYECKCPVGKVFDDPNSTNKTCIDKCLHKDRSKSCSHVNAICDPTRIESESDSIEEKFCVCKPGYVWKAIDSRKSKCVYGKYTAEFALSIKNTFHDLDDGLSQTQPKLVRSKRQTEHTVSYDLSGFANDLKSMNEENNKLNDRIQNGLKPHHLANALVHILKTVIESTSFKEEKESLTVEKCSINSDNYYNCIFTLNLKKPVEYYENLNEELANNCISYSGEPGNCFFPRQKNPSDSNNYFSLVINKELLAKNNLVNYKPCDKSRVENNCPEYTTCVEDSDPDSNLYSCVCNPEYFTEYGKEFIPTEDSFSDPKAVKYICKVRDLCANNCPTREQNGNCIQSEPRLNQTYHWVAHYYCSCNEHYRISSDNKSCTGVCDGIQCNRGKCVTKGSAYMCQCNEGWSGDNCDHEYKTSIAGWIAAIIVLSILLLISIGLFLLVLRNKGSDSGSVDMSNEMVDYSNNSYRMGDSGGGLVRVQSVSHGQQH